VQSSSSSIAASSSSLLSSSSRRDIVYGEPVTDSDGQTYQTVVIGSQTWMAKNLNKEIGTSSCYGNDNTYCDKYGRLYDWETVMNGTAGSDKNPSDVQGICPAGFHVPSDLEWGVLSNYIIINNGALLNYHLLSVDWDNGATCELFNICDEYGFSALPGGYYSGTYSTGTSARWWSATDNGANAYYYGHEGPSFTRPANIAKSNRYSLRCVKNYTPSSSSYTPVSCTSVPAGSFCDDRDGKVYKSVDINGKTWMAQNLNYEAKGCNEGKLGTIPVGWVCECSDNNCAKYGMLYNKTAAMALEPACRDSYCVSQISSPHQGICPKGWHVPSEAERDELISYAGGSSVAGQKLKALTGWNNTNGTNDYNFAALPAGLLIINNGTQSEVGTSGYWWNVRYGNNSHQTWGISGGNGVSITSLYYGSSMRCIKDSN
jgi:uncharacterized protein (TIGR02145 family)